MRWPFCLFAAIALGCGFAAGQESDPGPQPKTTPEDLAGGARIFGSQCAYCHGPKGEGGQGVVLARPRLPRAPDDQALFRIIREGIDGTRMPASALTTREIWQVVAHVRSLGRVEVSKISGDPQRGQRIYQDKGACDRCHSIRGRGGVIGPDLEDIGARQEAPYMKKMLLDPDASVHPDFLKVRVTTRDGKSIEGVRLNEDSFSIQVRDMSSHFHSFWKSELAEIVKETRRSVMPSYRDGLTPAELDDLVAYLESLQGGK